MVRPVTWLSHLGLKARRPLRALIVLTALAVGIGLAARRVGWVGPALANALRSVLGVEAVALIEEVVASVEDVVMRLTAGHSPPRRLEEVSPSTALPTSESGEQDCNVAEDRPLLTQPEALACGETTRATEQAAPAARSRFELPPLAPPFAQVAAAGDGVWIPVTDPARPELPPLLLKTLLHPDPERPFAEVFLVAMRTSDIQLHIAAGTEEPTTTNPEAATLSQRGLVPSDRVSALVAAFNGGFRAVHGRHGMMVDGVTLLPARADVCTIVGYPNGELSIGTWKRLTHASAQPAWYRQTPPCMLEQGKLHPGLSNPEARTWGATLEGETVIRRSAIALDASKTHLFVAMSNFTTAGALALALVTAGAHNAAQLDVNWSYPKFLVFPADASGKRHAETLFSGFFFRADEMLRVPTTRDFFYVLRAQPPVVAAAAETPISSPLPGEADAELLPFAANQQPQPGGAGPVQANNETPATGPAVVSERLQ